MSNIIKLLEGIEVEWKALGDVATLRRGRVMSKEYLADNAGDYPVYSSQTANNGEIGRIDTFDFDGEFISWTTDGGNAGTVFYRSGEFSITNVCGLIKINDELISAENLNPEAAKRYLTTSLKREYASENGTELNAILPKMSPLNPQYLTKKQNVFQKIAAFVDKFKGVGGKL